MSLNKANQIPKTIMNIPTLNKVAFFGSGGFGTDVITGNQWLFLINYTY